MKSENRQKVLAGLAIGVVGLFLLDKVVVAPLTAGWKDRAEQITKLQGDITKAKALVSRGAIMRRRWESMRAGTLVEESAERSLLEAFQKWADVSNVSISSIQPQWKREEDHSAMECRANASGNAKALARFIYELEKDPMALRVESFEVTSRDENGQVLTLGLQVSGLVLTTTEE
jgi:hypothetical protein